MDGESIKPYLPEGMRLPGGETRLRAVPQGDNVVRVEPRDPTLAASAPVHFEARADKVLEVVVELAPTADLLVEVVDGLGTPVPGSRVRLLQAFDASVPTLSELRSLSEQAARTLWYSGDTSFQPIGAALTDAEGRVRLPAVAGGRHWLALYGPGHVPRTFGPVVVGVPPTNGVRSVRVVVERGATLRGQILPLELLARLGTTPDIEAMRPLMNARQRTVADGRATRLFMRRVQQEQGQQKLQPDVVEVPVQGDGTFEHRGIPAGCYDVIFAAIVLHGMDDGHLLKVTIARVELRDGETTELRRDLSRLVPGRRDGRVLVNGKPYARESVYLFGDLQSGENTNMRLTLDADGRFAAQLVPGSYRLWLPHRTTGTLLVTSLPGNMGYWRSRTEAVVTSGQVTEHTPSSCAACPPTCAS